MHQISWKILDCVCVVCLHCVLLSALTKFTSISLYGDVLDFFSVLQQTFLTYLSLCHLCLSRFSVSFGLSKSTCLCVTFSLLTRQIQCIQMEVKDSILHYSNPSTTGGARNNDRQIPIKAGRFLSQAVQWTSRLIYSHPYFAHFFHQIYL